MPQHQAILAQNTLRSRSSASWCAFLAMTERLDQLYRRPARVPRPQRYARRIRPRCVHPDRPPLAGATGTRDPCAALQCVLELAPGETREIVVLLGAARSEAEAREPWRRYRTVARAQAASGSHRAGLGRAALGDYGAHTGAVVRRDGQPVDALPGAGLPDVGRGPRSTRAAERTGSATSCRT